MHSARSHMALVALLIQVLAQQTLFAPLLWADCPHHFALWTEQQSRVAGESAIRGPLCGQTRGRATPADDADHSGPCRCGDLQGHIPGAVQAPVPLSWQLASLRPTDSGLLLPLSTRPAITLSAAFLPDANAPPPTR